MGNREFNDNMRPLDAANEGDGAIDFNFDEVFKNIDGDTTDKSDTAKTYQNSERNLAVAFGKLCQWITDVKARDPRGLKAIGTRTVAAMWVINPEGPSHMVARSYGIAPNRFSLKAAEFSRAFKIQNAYQLHDAKNKRQAIR